MSEKRIYTPEELAKVKELHGLRLGCKKIARQLGVSTWYVIRACQELGLPANGINEGNKITLSPDKIQAIVALYQSGASSIKIAEQFSFSPPFIQKILKENGVSLRKYYEVNRKYDINEHFFDVIDTEEKAYFLGMLFSDGNVKKAHNANTVVLKLHRDDRDILSRLSHLLFNQDRLYESADNLILQFSSPFIKARLIDLGCLPAKSLILKYPSLLPILQKHFIRGYFDGDGCISLTEAKGAARYDFALSIISTEQFCQSAQTIIMSEIGIDGSITKEKESLARGNKITSKLNYGGNRRIAKIMDWMYEGATIFMERKHQRYLMLKEQNTYIDAKWGTRFQK